jgi:hypothetical protein
MGYLLWPCLGSVAGRSKVPAYRSSYGDFEVTRTLTQGLIAQDGMDEVIHDLILSCHGTVVSRP